MCTTPGRGVSFKTMLGGTIESADSPHLVVTGAADQSDACVSLRLRSPVATGSLKKSVAGRAPSIGSLLWPTASPEEPDPNPGVQHHREVLAHKGLLLRAVAIARYDLVRSQSCHLTDRF